MLRIFHAIESVKDQARLPQSEWTIARLSDLVQRGYSIALPNVSSCQIVKARWPTNYACTGSTLRWISCQKLIQEGFYLEKRTQCS